MRVIFLGRIKVGEEARNNNFVYKPGAIEYCQFQFRKYGI